MMQRCVVGEKYLTVSQTSGRVRFRNKGSLARHRTSHRTPSRITEIRDDALSQGGVDMFGVKGRHGRFIIRYGYEFDEQPSIL